MLPGAKRLLCHVFQDPDQPGLDEAALIKAFRRVRDEIGDFVRGIVQRDVRQLLEKPVLPELVEG